VNNSDQIMSGGMQRATQPQLEPGSRMDRKERTVGSSRSKQRVAISKGTVLLSVRLLFEPIFWFSTYMKDNVQVSFHNNNERSNHVE
jgi:hypothetical protein